MARAVVAGGAGAGVLALVLTMTTPHVSEFEGRRNQAYKDVVNVLTVCDGHTGSDIEADRRYTDKECDDFTKKDLKIAADGVLKTSPHLVWHPMQLAAATSFAYNVGVLTYSKSSVARLFNAGEFRAACDYLPAYKYANGKVFQGLINRRAREREICLSTLTAEEVKNVKP